MKVSIARRAATFTLIGATAWLMAACSSVKLDDVNGANSSSSGGSSNFGSQPWNDPKSPLFEKSVYFGFDEYIVQTKYQKMLSAHPLPRDRAGRFALFPFAHSVGPA